MRDLPADCCVDCGTAPRDCARGLCMRCYNRHRWAGTLADFERRNWPADELLGEWEMLRDSGHTVAGAAGRLGVTHAALCQAVSRALARGDSRGRRAPFGRAL